jgi:hypothetical protein
MSVHPLVRTSGEIHSLARDWHLRKHLPCDSAGQAGAAWAQVAAFYSFFQGFATLKDFAWADEHNPAAAPNRKVDCHEACIIDWAAACIAVVPA